jgi:hypothetical protein
MMKKTICVVLVVILSAFSLVTSSSDALDNKTKEIVLAKVFLEDNNNHRERPAPEKKVEPLYLIDNNYIVREQPVLHKDGIEAGTVVHREELYVPLSSYITRNKIHQPLVYKSFDVFSYEKIKKPFKSSALDLEFRSILSGVKQGRVLQIGMAFITTLALHELGHVVVADYVGATGIRLNFLKKRNGNFFLGSTTVEQIDNKSLLPLSMGGAVASDLTFEHALQNYRKKPTLYNKSLLFFSAADFLWYSAYAFYLSDGHPHFDPISISSRTGISKDLIFSIALAKTIVNTYRVYTSQDRVIPYFTVDKNSAILNISMAF